MKLIAGLGNPGKKYVNTRHNIGFIVIDALVEELESESLGYSDKHQSEHVMHKELLIVKPQTFMNSSGDTIKSLANFYKVHSTEIYIVHDDLDLKLGEYKIQKGVGPKVHGGINSIEEKLGTKDFWRIRIGVDNREPDKESRVKGEEYVLQNFEKEELEILHTIIHKVVNDLDSILS